MTKRPVIDNTYLTETLVELLKIPSPTGYAQDAIAYCADQFKALGLEPNLSIKGSVNTTMMGTVSDQPRAFTAHADTLGAVVKEIKPNGRLKLSRIGAFAWQTVEAESCQIFTHEGRTIHGSVLPIKASYHIYSKEVETGKRDDDAMEVRLDEQTHAADDTRSLGIRVGDFVAFDPRVVVSDAGFIRSRHLDDKACVACLLTAAKALKDAGITPTQRTTFHISNFEEVGHGGSVDLPDDLHDLVVVDMAAVGEGQASDEFHATICVKDSTGPYHSALTHQLIDVAKDAGLNLHRDIYDYYGSDGSAYWRAGGQARVALIGPGVDASHHYERTHLQALIATVQLILAYVMQ